MSRGRQRWLKTMLQAVSAYDDMFDVAEERDAGAPVQRAEPPAEAGVEERKVVDLEDLLLGRGDVSEHPELAEELEGLSEIVDMLREAGEKRRKLGEELLRRDLLGDEPEEETGPEDGDDEDTGDDDLIF